MAKLIFLLALAFVASLQIAYAAPGLLGGGLYGGYGGIGLGVGGIGYGYGGGLLGGYGGYGGYGGFGKSYQYQGTGFGR